MAVHQSNICAIRSGAGLLSNTPSWVHVGSRWASFPNALVKLTAPERCAIAMRNMSDRTGGFGVAEYDQLDFVSLLSQIPDLGGQPAPTSAPETRLNDYSTHRLNVDVKSDVPEPSSVRSVRWTHDHTWLAAIDVWL